MAYSEAKLEWNGDKASEFASWLPEIHSTNLYKGS